MERINSSQQNQHVAGLEDEKTPVLGQEVTAITASDQKSDNSKRRSPSAGRLPAKVVLGVLLGAVAVGSGIYTYRRWQSTQQYAQRYQETDNAYVTADINQVTSQISGIVTEIPINDNQIVSSGKVLVKLDARDQQISLAQAKASLELAKQQAALAQENLKALTVNSSSNSVSGNKNTQAISLQQSQISPQKKINQQQYKTALATIAQKEADLKKAQLQLSNTNVTALVGGKIANKNVQLGQRVQPGQTLVTIVQPHPWIIANFKETQLEKIQPGQKVQIKIAAFPSRKFQGKVESISSTSFGKFTFPSQENATANSTQSSDVQRIPVKIALEPESIRGYESRISPGMSAVAVVETK